MNIQLNNWTYVNVLMKWVSQICIIHTQCEFAFGLNTTKWATTLKKMGPFFSADIGRETSSSLASCQSFTGLTHKSNTLPFRLTFTTPGYLRDTSEPKLHAFSMWEEVACRGNISRHAHSLHTSRHIKDPCGQQVWAMEHRDGQRVKYEANKNHRKVMLVHLVDSGCIWMQKRGTWSKTSRSSICDLSWIQSPSRNVWYRRECQTCGNFPWKDSLGVGGT